jgi:hypothetical protein
MACAGWQNSDVARAYGYGMAAFATERDFSGAGDESENLVRG